MTTTEQVSGRRRQCWAGSRASHSLLPGLLILGAGVLLLLAQMDMIAIEEIWKLWPVALIVGGAAHIVRWWKERR